MTTTKKMITALAILLTAVSASLVTGAGTAAAVDTRWLYTNGCTLSPDGIPGFYNFRDICNLHDVCYARFMNGSHQYGSNEAGRLTCDNQFLANMRSYCTARFAWWDPRRSTCSNTALTYYSAVRAYGVPFYYDNNWLW